MYPQITGLRDGQATEAYPKAVVALAGARDYYQLPLALHEAGLLEALVTDMYWPDDRKYFPLSSILSPEVIAARRCSGLPGARVRVPSLALCVSAVMKIVGTTRLNRYKDKVLSS